MKTKGIRRQSRHHSANDIDFQEERRQGYTAQRRVEHAALTIQRYARGRMLRIRNATQRQTERGLTKFQVKVMNSQTVCRKVGSEDIHAI